MVTLKQVGIAYVILSVFCGILFAILMVMLPGMLQERFSSSPAEPVDFWPSFWSVLPLGLVLGFILSPICYACSQLAS